eukprot:GHUV01017432.1.p1 GENE.GHUV01017432.1~~GHUV01017432.1.p1  ORF type:complete len:138 (+),score=10.29 GHUV01017432.1:785-1198(+)
MRLHLQAPITAHAMVGAVHSWASLMGLRKGRPLCVMHGSSANRDQPSEEEDRPRTMTPHTSNNWHLCGLPAQPPDTPLQAESADDPASAYSTKAQHHCANVRVQSNKPVVPTCADTPTPDDWHFPPCESVHVRQHLC